MKLVLCFQDALGEADSGRGLPLCPDPLPQPPDPLPGGILSPDGFCEISILRKFWEREGDRGTAVVWENFLSQDALGEADSGRGLPLCPDPLPQPPDPLPGGILSPDGFCKMSVLRKSWEREVDCGTAVLWECRYAS